MKLLATADLHLGASPDFGRAPFGPESRLADQERAWLSVCELAVSEEVDALVFAGDAFHRRRPTPAEILAFRTGLDELCRHGIPVFAISGNHDVTTADQPCSLDIFLGELELHREPAVRDFHGVTLAFLPWTPAAHLVAQRDGGDRDELHRDVGGILVDVARGLRAQCPDDKPAILATHWSIGSAQTPTGAFTDDFREPVIARDDLTAIGFDLIAAGHIHRPQFLDDAGRVFYVGSPCVVDFGEADSAHGCVLVDTEAAPPTRFMSIADRPFVTVDVDFEDGDDFSMILEGYAPHCERYENAVVRVRYRCTPEQAKHVDHAAIRQALIDAGAWRVYAIQPDIVRADRARVQGVDETLGPREACDLWLAKQELGALSVDLVRAKRDEILERAGVS